MLMDYNTPYEASFTFSILYLKKMKQEKISELQNLELLYL